MMLKLVTLAVLFAAAFAAPPCGCEETISALEKRVELLEAKLHGAIANSMLSILYSLPYIVISFVNLLDSNF